MSTPVTIELLDVGQRVVMKIIVWDGTAESRKLTIDTASAALPLPGPESRVQLKFEGLTVTVTVDREEPLDARSLSAEIVEARIAFEAGYAINSTFSAFAAGPIPGSMWTALTIIGITVLVAAVLVAIAQSIKPKKK